MICPALKLSKKEKCMFWGWSQFYQDQTALFSLYLKQLFRHPGGQYTDVHNSRKPNTQYNVLQIGFLIWNAITMVKLNIFSLHSSNVLCVALRVTSIRSPPPTSPTSSLPFLCSQTPLRQGCKGADLLWFSWTRRRQTGRERGKRRIHSKKPRSSHPAAGAHLFPSELMYSSQGQSDARNKGVEREGERCEKRQEENRLCIQTEI